jgi:hypothetical protein
MAACKTIGIEFGIEHQKSNIVVGVTVKAWSPRIFFNKVPVGDIMIPHGPERVWTAEVEKAVAVIHGSSVNAGIIGQITAQHDHIIVLKVDGLNARKNALIYLIFTPWMRDEDIFQNRVGLCRNNETAAQENKDDKISFHDLCPLCG